MKIIVTRKPNTLHELKTKLMILNARAPQILVIPQILNVPQTLAGRHHCKKTVEKNVLCSYKWVI